MLCAGQQANIDDFLTILRTNRQLEILDGWRQCRVATSPTECWVGDGEAQCTNAPIEPPCRRGNQGETRWLRFMLLVGRCRGMMFQLGNVIDMIGDENPAHA